MPKLCACAVFTRVGPEGHGPPPLCWRRYSGNLGLTSALDTSDGIGHAPGDASIASTSRVSFGIVFPSGLGIPSSYMFFDKEKPVERIVAAACKHAGLTLEKGRLSGSPERLNLFTLDGDVVRLDLEVEAHLGSTLHPGNILLLEKGNRVHAERLRTVKEVLLLGVGS